MSTISWGRQERFAFSAGGSLEAWAPPAIPAVYAVTYQRDPLNKPRGHTVFYFGETDNLARNADSIKAKIRDILHRDGGSGEDLSVFIHSMENSTPAQRARVLERLVLEYQPQGNRTD